MPLGMKNNIASINAINHLAKAQKEMSDSLTRLATGERINSGADGPGSLVMSEGLRAQIAGVQQALQNTEFSLSMVQTAEGALVEVNNLLIEMRQLALTAANEGVSDWCFGFCGQYFVCSSYNKRSCCQRCGTKHIR